MLLFSFQVDSSLVEFTKLDFSSQYKFRLMAVTDRATSIESESDWVSTLNGKLVTSLFEKNYLYEYNVLFIVFKFLVAFLCCHVAFWICLWVYGLLS